MRGVMVRGPKFEVFETSTSERHMLALPWLDAPAYLTRRAFPASLALHAPQTSGWPLRMDLAHQYTRTAI